MLTKFASSNATTSAISDLAAQTSVSFRSASDGQEKTLQLRDANSSALAGAAPWRGFRWAMGQKHYSGTYWSATVNGPVIYESRLARLWYADFDPSVNRIVAQPFLLKTEIDGQARKHMYTCRIRIWRTCCNRSGVRRLPDHASVELLEVDWHTRASERVRVPCLWLTVPRLFEERRQSRPSRTADR